MTATIQVPQHLAEYARNLFGTGRGDGSVRFPYSTVTYHLLVDGMSRQRDGQPPVTGNLVVVLPSPDAADEGVTKNPRYYCHIPIRTQHLIGASLRHRFNYEFLTMMTENELRGRPVPHLTMIRRWLRSRGIRSISEDALVKKFRRYRRLLYPKTVRKYEKKARR